MPLKEFLLVNTQMLHKFLMLNFLPALMITFHLILQFFHTVTFVPIFLQFLPPEVISIQQLLLENSH